MEKKLFQVYQEDTKQSTMVLFLQLCVNFASTFITTKEKFINFLHSIMHWLYAMYLSDIFNPFLANAPISYTLKTQENLRFSGVSNGENGNIDLEWVNPLAFNGFKVLHNIFYGSAAKV